MASTPTACMWLLSTPDRENTLAHRCGRYNGTSELQLERMNVYFNEVSRDEYTLL